MVDGKAAAAPLEVRRHTGRSGLSRDRGALARARTQGLAIVLVALIAFFALRAPGFATSTISTRRCAISRSSASSRSARHSS